MNTILNNLVNSPYSKYYKREYLDILFNIETEEEFYNFVIENSMYHLQRYKRVSKRSKKSNHERNLCIEYILKQYMLYLLFVDKKEAEEIQQLYKEKILIEPTNKVEKEVVQEVQELQTEEVNEEQKEVNNNKRGPNFMSSFICVLMNILCVYYILIKV